MSENSNNGANVPLSVDEMRAMRKRLMEAMENLATNLKLPKEINRDICEIVRRCSGKNQDDKDLVDLAHLVAISATWPHFMREAKQYLDAHRTEMDDLYQAYCVCMYEELHDYNPEFDLITFMTPRVKPVFAQTRRKGTGSSMSKHYLDAGVKVRNAQQALAKLGNTNPSPEDIYEYIYGSDKRTSIVTIRRYMAQDPKTVPYDPENGKLMGNKIIDGPEEAYLKYEDMRIFYETKDRLIPKYQTVINIELEYEKEHGEMPSIQKMCEIMEKDYKEKISEKGMNNLVVCAHQHMRDYYMRRKKRGPRPPINRIKSDSVATKEEDYDIVAALMEDPDLLDSSIE